MIETFTREKRTSELENQGIQFSFEWQAMPKEWAGMKPNDLIEFSNEAAKFFGIKPNDLAKIRIIFGDHRSFTCIDGTITPLCREFPEYQEETGKFLRADIVLNRSIELLLNVEGLELDFLETRDKPEEYDYVIEDGVIYCTLKDPKEAIKWFIAEEINHAAYDIKLVSEEAFDIAEAKYSEYITKLHSTTFNEKTNSYTLKLVEVTASRQVLRLLAKYFRYLNPERSRFFKEMYRLSLDKRMAVIPRTELILSELYIKTGYKTTKGI